MNPGLKRCSCCKWKKLIVWEDYGIFKSVKERSKGQYAGVNLCFDCLVQLGFPEVDSLKYEYSADIKECISCDKPFMITPGKEWAVKCPSCWIKENNSVVPIEEVEFICTAKSKRRQHSKEDTEKLQEQRQEWCEQLSNLQLNPPIQVLEMYKDENGEVVKGPLFIPQYFQEYYLCNTRTKLLTETRFECDKLHFQEAIKVIYEVSKELQKKNFSHYVFYAEGQRSPHIIIYCLSELEDLPSHYRFKCQENFWKWIAPWQVQHADHSLWLDEHEFVPLEFSPHWKTGNPFILCWEVKCNDRNSATAPA